MSRAVNRRSRKFFLIVSAVVMGLVALIPTVPAAAREADQCVVHVLGVDKDNNFILSPMECYTTYADVLRANGAKNVSNDAHPSTTTQAVLDDITIIGTHYDGASWSGASFSVQGDFCGGGGLNVPLAWNDRISSTANGCNDIVHYENTNYGGGTFTTTGVGGNLSTSMDNKTSSIKYFA